MRVWYAGIAFCVAGWFGGGAFIGIAGGGSEDGDEPADNENSGDETTEDLAGDGADNGLLFALGADWSGAGDDMAYSGRETDIIFGGAGNGALHATGTATEGEVDQLYGVLDDETRID